MPPKSGIFKIVAAVILIWLLAPAAMVLLHISQPNMGQFGDMFGAANALFSGLAFSALFYTLHMQQQQIAMQQQQLELQRNELALQREEMKASRGELANQVRMQHSLIRATLAQIAVSGLEAEIEADKLDAQAHMAVVRTGNVGQSAHIRSRAKAISALSEKLERELPDVG